MRDLIDRKTVLDTLRTKLNADDDWLMANIYEGMMFDYLKRFSFQEVYDAAEIAVDKYFRGDAISFNDVIHKIGGICYNRRKNNGLL